MTEAIIIVIWAIVFLVGLTFGIDMVAKDACNSVKMEWVKDKCMKVTREEVK